MSFASKINVYRELKRMAAENRHLYARLLSNIDAPSPSRRVAAPCSGLYTSRTPGNRKYLFTTKGEDGDPRYKVSVSIPLHHRCALTVGVASAASKEEAELCAIIAALGIASSSTEWRRIMRVLNTDLFVAFVTLLTTVNAYALIQVVRTGPERASSVTSHASWAAENGPQFRATVALELASIDDSETILISRSDPIAAGYVPLRRSTAADQQAQALQNWQNGSRYDIGVAGDWSPSARDAIKSALFKSLDVLQNHAVDEWREAGREGALLLNELSRGGCCTSERDVCVLNSALRCGNTAVDPPYSAAEDVVLRFRCVATSDSISVTATPIERAQMESHIAPTRASLENSAGTSFFGATKSVLSAEATRPVMTDEVHVPFSISAVTILRPFVDGDCYRSEPAPKELLWPRQCMLGATLLLLAAAKASLYRSAAPTCSAWMFNGSAALEGASTSSVLCKSLVVSAVEWARAPFFSAFCGPAALLHGFFSLDEPWGVESDAVQDAADSSAQNHWHCPDVAVMIASMRSALQLPLRSYPKITFEQTAFHDPARRMRELAQGLHGDVDVLTRVHVRWETSRGCFVASAVSDPALHHRNATQSGSGVSFHTRLSCADTGRPRGPLLLLVSAVCSLYDQVVSSASTGAAGRYPVVPVKNFLARGGLDFLLFSWFEASPQVRCFAIGTTPPTYAELARSEAATILNGSTRHELGHSMTRAMLFYDILGQRVLFAETHATSAADAVARVDMLSVEQNCIHHDFYALPCATAQRSFRSVPRQRQWQRSRELLERSMQLRIAAVDDAGTSKSARHHHHRVAVAASMRACIGACASEVCALWTVLGIVAKLAAARVTAAAGSDCISGEKSLPDHQPLLARFLEDPSTAADLFAGEDDNGVERGWRLGSHGVTWNCRALGKEAAPPRAGVMEVQLCMRASLGAAATADGKQAETASFKLVVLRCRVDALRSEPEVTKSEWFCEERLTEPLALCCFPTLIFTTSKPVSGVFPAMVLLCRRALEYIYSEARFASLMSILPPVRDILAWCAAAAPLLDGALGGYPPYNARFYAAPKLLGELLQGAAGKYRCDYDIPPARDTVTSIVSDVDWDEGSAEVARCKGVASMAAAQTSTIFYTSKPIHVNAGSAEVTTRRQYGSRLPEPLSVSCTLYLESLLGHGVSPLVSAVSPACPAPAAMPFVLGHGVGRTKREAWRSAAWQALRLQFPEVLAQLEAYRDASELLQRPAQLNRLVRSSGLDRNGVWGEVVSVIYKLHFDCSARSSSFMRHAATEVAAAAPVQGVRQIQCEVTAVRTDGSKVCVVPGCAAAASSAGKAYTAAVAAVLRAVRGAAQETPTDVSGATMRTAPSHMAWASTRPSAPCSVGGMAQRPRFSPYSAWRDTTHYGKSVWHAYAGALSAYLDSDVLVNLVCGEGARVDELGLESRGVRGGRRFRRRVMLSKVQVRMRDWHAGAATAPKGVELRCTEQLSGSLSSITSFEAFSVAVGCHAVGSSVIDAADGILFERTAASLLACCSSPLDTRTYNTHVDAVAAAVRLPSEQPCCLLQEITRWLRAITQQCALPLALREELRGLLLARACDMARIQGSYRLTPAERVEALLMWWVGRRSQVCIRRIDPSVTASPSLANQMAWAAEALIEIHGERRRSGPRSSHTGLSPVGNSSPLPGQGDELASREDTRKQLAYPWVAARAIGTTSDEAAWKLYLHVSEALRGVVDTKPSPPSPEKR
ncbi:hypothetical protein LSCM4_06876 [Leishmania orientalis]|uniref:Uncharacterized protein n=1 Tax=Leishmania orientalis TaxID=2249476 RepID=A0A836HCV6_9TRYP|nr:hypothetical protein LSCM4_06876 [Leishmania orientalis]